MTTGTDPRRSSRTPASCRRRPLIGWTMGASRHDEMDMLAQGRIRGTSEKSWGATKRATDALALARTGEEPELTPETGAGLRMLTSLDNNVWRARLLRH